MLAIEPRCFDGGDLSYEHLQRTGSHLCPCLNWPWTEYQAQCARSTLKHLELEVLVGELGAVDGLAAGPIAVGEVSTLNHKVLDHSVEL